MRLAAGSLVALLVLAAVVRAQEVPAPSPAPAASPSPAASPMPDPTAVALEKARRLIDEGRPSAALEELRSAPATDPRVRVLTAVARYHANDPLPAIEELTAVLPSLPADSMARREAVQVLGLSHYLAGHLGDAIPYLEQTRAFAPENSDLAYILGMAYIQTRQPDRARETWARAFHVAPDSAAGHLVAAQMMVRAEMEDMAQAELTAALKKDPRLPQANLLLGQAALFRGRLDEAIALFQKELEASPGNAMAYYRMGDAYTRQLQWDKAIAALQRSVWLNPYFSGPYILMGKAYQAKGDRGAAEGMLRRAVSYDPNNKAAHYILAQVLQQLGRAEEAKTEFEIAQRLQATTDR
jgi:tetratricopeptide (TPR) repeat protein